MKKSAHKSSMGKSSAVIKPGTGSGIGLKAGSTKTPSSEPADKQGLSRKPPGALR
jgi:hypothetical protein